MGIGARKYEYRRYEMGATPYFPPLRFPGHYYDAETDLFENWHRNYSPSLTQYLQPEPLLSSPQRALTRLRDGSVLPSHVYADNNSINRIDSTGLLSWVLECAAVAGVDRGFSLQKTVFGRRWRSTPGVVALENPQASACDDLEIAEDAQSQMISNRYGLLAGECWDALVEEIRAQCAGKKTQQPEPQPPPNYACAEGGL